MCTTYVGHKIADRLEKEGHTVDRTLLVRLNPAAKHKTRGNAAIAIHTDAPAEVSLEIASTLVSSLSASSDGDTNPGVVVSSSDAVSDEIRDFTMKVITSLRKISETRDLIEKNDLLQYFEGNGRGRIGCLAAVGAWEAINDWTYETITYRVEENRGTERMVDVDSVFEYADEYYPLAWDTVDRFLNSAVCVPNSPGPILYGVRGDSETAVQGMSEMIQEEEPVDSRHTFTTNQGTDVHIQQVDSISQVEEDSGFRFNAEVTDEPHTVEGGHVFFEVSDEKDSIDVVAFEPTKHFRDTVRDLREGDELTVCGEVSNDTLKLEKFAVRSLNTKKMTNPTCPDCGNSMSSAGRDQGYSCRDCSNHRDSQDEVEIERELENGWYEVPPCARRHISKPLIRGGFDDVTHPFN
jgi:tRNA(Ile2)-agmatinylcytidine synthase